MADPIVEQVRTNYAAVAVSDPGIVFDEKRSNVNYWEPWYLGFDPQQTRKPAHRASLLWHPAAAMLGEQRPQNFRFIAVEHAAARGALAAFRDRHDHAMQCLDILLRRLHAGKNIPQIDQHSRALIERAEIFDRIELPFKIAEEGLDLLLAGRLRFTRHRECLPLS